MGYRPIAPVLSDPKSFPAVFSMLTQQSPSAQVPSLLQSRCRGGGGSCGLVLFEQDLHADVGEGIAGLALEHGH